MRALKRELLPLRVVLTPNLDELAELTLDHPDYAPLMGVPPKTSGGGTSGAPAQAAPASTYQAPAAQRAPVTGKPSWAQ